jgi:undecaprenyl-diphosphatase
VPDAVPRDARANPLILFLAAALFLFIFGFVAQEVTEGKTSAFDRFIILSLRDPANPSVPLGPAWLQEAARDVTSLGSIVVLAIITFAVVGYLFLARKHVAALLMLIAVFGGVALNDLLKAAIARPRPDIVTHAVRVFTTSFPSGHASLSAITYLTVGALLAQSQSSHKVSIYFMALAAFLTVIVGTTRIYLGVHYPTDVLGGWCIGAAWAMACWIVAARVHAADRIEPAGAS